MDAHKLMKDGDWERRNRLKVYEGLYNVFIRNFEKGSSLLLDSLSTFASTELLTFHEFVLHRGIGSHHSFPRRPQKEDSGQPGSDQRESD